MSLDAICLRALVSELTPQLLGARIDKVQQPARDQIVLTIRGRDRLLFNAGPNQPRVQFTAQTRDNPDQPPMFCMLLRKHLVGARILSVEQPDLERIVIFTLHATDELGQSGERKLVLEAMGRRANLILIDGDGRILDCLRRVDFDPSGERQLLPGLFYRLPAALAKCSLLASPEEAIALSQRGGREEETVEQWLLDAYLGLSPLTAREIACRACGSADLRFSELDGAARERLSGKIQEWIDILKENRFTPTILYRGGKPVDFTYCAVTQYGSETEVSTRASFSALLDEFYGERERQELAARRSRELTHAANTARDRLCRKAELLRGEYAATQKRDELRLCGDLIMANLYQIARGSARFTAENYYEDPPVPKEIALDPRLTAQQNAAKYYKQYNKAKTAEHHLREQIEKAESEQQYLASVLEEIRLCETEQEFAEIRREMQETGYLRAAPGGKKTVKRAFSPREFRTSAGLRVLVGRSNIQNDALTRQADRRDLWFHTQKIHGSHVILCTGGAQPDDASIREAAMLAAYYSQAQNGSNVPVDYTAVRNVKKPGGARPGMVTYETYRTLFVTPDAALAAALARKA